MGDSLDLRLLRLVVLLEGVRRVLGRESGELGGGLIDVSLLGGAGRVGRIGECSWDGGSAERPERESRDKRYSCRAESIHDWSFSNWVGNGGHPKPVGKVSSPQGFVC